MQKSLPGDVDTAKKIGELQVFRFCFFIDMISWAFSFLFLREHILEAENIILMFSKLCSYFLCCVFSK